MKKAIFFSFLIVLLVGCTNKRYDFDTVEKISTSNVPIGDTIFMKYPYRTAMNDSLLFILDLHASENFVHTFSTNDLAYHHSICKVGSGPDEFVSIDHIQLDGDSLYVFSFSNEIFVYHVDDIYHKNGNNRRIKLTTDFGFLSRGLKLGDYFYFPVFNVASDGRILQFDTNGKFIRSFGSLELSHKRTPIESATYQAWMPFLGGTGRTIVAATQFGDVVEIYNNYEQITIKGRFGDPVFRNQNGYAIHEGIHGFQDVVVKNGHLFVLFSGIGIKDQKVTEQGGDKIYIFDFEGNPKKKIELDRSLMSIHMDMDGSFLGLDVNSNTPLYRFTIPEV